jgi:hypothetical protein
MVSNPFLKEKFNKKKKVNERNRALARACRQKNASGQITLERRK